MNKINVKEVWDTDLLAEAILTVQTKYYGLSSEARQQILTRACIKFGSYELLAIHAQQSITAQEDKENHVFEQ